MDNTRELYMNMEHAYTQFHKTVAEYINNAEYPIDYLTRDIYGKVNTAMINMPGGGRIVFRANEWNVILPVEGNPVNPDLLTKWEKTEIDTEIEYHNTQLNNLIKRKQELQGVSVL